jgi:hypothetical protein
MPKFRFIGRVPDDNPVLPGCGIETGIKEIKVGEMDIDDRSVMPILDVLAKESHIGTKIEASKKDDNGYWLLVAAREGKQKKLVAEIAGD